MKTKQYANFKYTLIWDESHDQVNYMAYGNVNGQFLLVHTNVSEEFCIKKMEHEIETKIIAHQI